MGKINHWSTFDLNWIQVELCKTPVVMKEEVRRGKV